MIGIMFKINNRIRLLIAFFIAIFICITYMKKIQMSQVCFIFMICEMIFTSLLFSSENKLIKQYIGDYYRWDAR